MQADSFTQIYQSYFDPVYRYALSLSGSPHIAEEITQETFFKALRSLNQFQGRSSLKSWLCAIAKNLWLSEQREKRSADRRCHASFRSIRRSGGSDCAAG